MTELPTMPPDGDGGERARALAKEYGDARAREATERYRATSATLAFAAVTAVQDGLLDEQLQQLWSAVRNRRMLLDPERPPALPTPESHQVWVWMNHRDRSPCWEVRGTGVVLGPPPE